MAQPCVAEFVNRRGVPFVCSESKHGLSAEYTLSSPGVSFSTLICCTLAVWTFTYPVSTYAQAPALLASAAVVLMLGTFVYLHWVKVQHESILQEVIYYLCVLVRNDQKSDGLKAILPVFLAARPRLDCLRKVYRGCQEILHAEPNKSTCMMDH
uniref:phosphatidylinositol N-acetylglucosaminyltransferase subunit H isoform X2 n=1 Tax=Myxine glutinosa TaxID=7769 RepID=UPI00358F2F64